MTNFCNVNIAKVVKLSYLNISCFRKRQAKHGTVQSCMSRKFQFIILSNDQVTYNHLVIIV